MKKFISLVICAAIVVSSCAMFASAAKKDDYPVIFVPGFLCAFVNVLDAPVKLLFPVLIQEPVILLIRELYPAIFPAGVCHTLLIYT